MTSRLCRYHRHRLKLRRWKLAAIVPRVHLEEYSTTARKASITRRDAENELGAQIIDSDGRLGSCEGPAQKKETEDRARGSVGNRPPLVTVESTLGYIKSSERKVQMRLRNFLRGPLPPVGDGSRLRGARRRNPKNLVTIFPAFCRRTC